MTKDNTLPPDFNPNEFAPLSLLERGDVDVWVRRRGAILLDKSKEIAKDCEASKLASAITIGASVVMSSNPLAWLPLTIGAIGYVYTVFQEFQDTGSIRIIPMYRGKLGDILSIMEGGIATQRHPLEDQIEYLSEAEKDEALLVNYRFGEIASILNSAPPKVRFDLYRHLCGQFHARRDIITLDEVKHYISSAVSEARRSFVIPNTPAVELEQTLIAELPITSTTSLSEQGGTEALATRTAAAQVSAQNITVNFFDFTRLRTEPDKFAHLRVIGGTGIGKTTFVDWLLDTLGGERFVITPKKKSWNWVGLKVYGLWFDYETIRTKLQWIHAEMYRRYPLMAAGQTFEITNFVVDEWRLINTNVKAIKERDPETKQTIEVAPSAKAMMKDIITVARESMLRLIALAQGENVASWGFEGESDLEECFTDIRLGEFAIDYAKSLRNQCRKDSDDYEYWTAVLGELERQNQQRTREGKSIPCCMVGKHPARIPDLTDWKRDISDSTSAETPSTQLTETDPSTPPDPEATESERKLTVVNVEDARKPDDTRLEGFLAQIASALSLEASDTLPPLLDGLDRNGKLLMLRALLSQNLGKEKTILLAWGQKSGGRNHEKYKYAAELLEAMMRELNGLGFNDENNWGLGDANAN
ncbi:hypothetical protein NDI39_29305 [Microcoleus sp. ZQ-A2]|nr:hypothetical protein [Microcoleus sp. FACHB-1]